MSFEGSAAPEQQERLESTTGGNPTPPAEIASLMANDDYEATRSWDIGEDMKTDLTALVVLDDIPIEVRFRKSPRHGVSRHNHNIERLTNPRQSTRFSASTTKRWTHVCGLPTHMTPSQTTIPGIQDPKEHLTRSTASGALPLSASAWERSLLSFEIHPGRLSLCPDATLPSCERNSTSSTSRSSSTESSQVEKAKMAPSSCNQSLVPLTWRAISSHRGSRRTKALDDGTERWRSRDSAMDMVQSGRTMRKVRTSMHSLSLMTFQQRYVRSLLSKTCTWVANES